MPVVFHYLFLSTWLGGMAGFGGVPVFCYVCIESLFSKGVKSVITWWWLILAFIAGEMAGIMAIAIISGRQNDDEHS